MKTKEIKKITHREMMIAGIKKSLPEIDEITINNFLNECKDIDEVEELSSQHIENFISIYSLTLPEQLEKFYNTFDVEYSVWMWNGEYWKDGEKKTELLGTMNIDLSHSYEDVIDRFLENTLSRKLGKINHHKLFEVTLTERNMVSGDETIDGYLSYKEERKDLEIKIQEKAKQMILDYHQKENPSHEWDDIMNDSFLDDLD